MKIMGWGFKMKREKESVFFVFKRLKEKEPRKL